MITNDDNQINYLLYIRNEQKTPPQRPMIDDISTQITVMYLFAHPTALYIDL